MKIRNYKEKVRDWLSEEFINTDRDRSDESIDIHVDEFIVEEEDRAYFVEGMNIFKALVELSKENSWTNDFIPTLRINLKYTKSIKKIKVSSIDDVVKEISDTPPEIVLWRKILFTNKWDGYKEIYEASLHEEFNKIFNTIFPEEYKIYYKSEKYFDEMFYGRMICENNIYVQYNENNSETVTNVKRINFNR